MDFPRARLRSRYDPQYSPPRDDAFGTLDRTHRSRSLDLRRAYHDEDEDDFYARDRHRSSQPHIPRRYDFEPDSPRHRPRELARSQEFYPSRQPDSYPPPSPQDRYRWRQQSHPRTLQRQPANVSPVSQTSGRPLKIATVGRAQGQRAPFYGPQRREPDASPRSSVYPPEYRELPRARYDDRPPEIATPGGGAAAAAAGGGGYSRSYQHHSYHQSSAAGGPRRNVTVQPTATAWKTGPNGPQRYHRVHCCCLNFTWPPWSVEPAEPPQQLYRNI